MKYLLFLLLCSCAIETVPVVCIDNGFQPHVLRYYYDNQFTIIPRRVVRVMTEDIDTTVVFAHTPKRLETVIVLPSRPMTFQERDQIVKRALDYVLKDIK